MEPREQRIGWYLALASIPVLAVITTPWNGGENLAAFGFTLVFPASFALVIRQGHRIWTAFGAFLVGLLGPWSFAYLAGAPFVAFAFWLALRARREALAVPANAPPRDISISAANARPASSPWWRRRRRGAAADSSDTPSDPRTARRTAPSRSKPSDAGVKSGRVTPKGTARRRSPKRS